MAYRENDPKVLEEADNRAALERLAAVGLAKKSQLVAAKHSVELAAKTRATSKRFRQRAWASPRKLRFTGFWFATCAALAILFGLAYLVATRDIALAIANAILAFICLNLSAIAAIHVIGLYVIHAAIWQRRDAVALAQWSVSLPFAMGSFVETLSLDHDLNDLRVVVRFVHEAPEQTLLDGLVGNLERADRARVATGERTCAFYRSGLTDGTDPPNDVVAFVRELVTKVLLPLHAVHTIESTKIDEETTQPL